MSIPTTTITVDDVYGDGWWERTGKKAVEGKRWEFRQYKRDEVLLMENCDTIKCSIRTVAPRIVILPTHPTLREMYGADEVQVPEGWEWTGECRVPVKADYWLTDFGKSIDKVNHYLPRLILLRTQPKVWFKAEETDRPPLAGQWYWRNSWQLAVEDFRAPYLCATRHEEPTPAYTLTQVEYEKGVKL